MRYVLIAIYLSSSLVGCAQMPSFAPKWLHKQAKPTTTEVKTTSDSSASDVNKSTLPSVDLQHDPKLLEQYRLAKPAIGGWINQKLGNFYQTVQPAHHDSAIIYLYRPYSRWNHQEIVPVSIFINNFRIPSLVDDHYYWLELPAGTYRLSSSRPLMGIHFQSPKYVDMTVEAGQSYFVKYNEENGISKKEHTGPWMVVPKEIADKEIAFTRLKSPSYRFIREDDAGKQYRKPQEVAATHYDEKKEVVLIQPFKLLDPRTW